MIMLNSRTNYAVNEDSDFAVEYAKHISETKCQLLNQSNNFLDLMVLPDNRPDQDYRVTSVYASATPCLHLECPSAFT